MQGALSYVKGNEEVRGGKDEMWEKRVKKVMEIRDW
jgi:hypothetical protein